MQPPRTLIACIGNIFLGDEAFGVAAAEQLSAAELPDNVQLRDFGVRGRELAHALLEPWDAVIIVDALRRGGTPGTLYVIEPDPEAGDDAGDLALESNNIDPAKVLRLARVLGGAPERVLVVGCEPSPRRPGGQYAPGLSEPVRAAVRALPTLIESIVDQLATESRAAVA